MSVSTTIEIAGNIQTPTDLKVNGEDLKMSISPMFVIQSEVAVKGIRSVLENQAKIYHHMHLERLGEPIALNPLEGTYTQGLYSESLDNLQADLRDFLKQRYDIAWQIGKPIDGYRQRLTVTEPQLPWLKEQDHLDMDSLLFISRSMSKAADIKQTTKIPFTGGQSYAEK